MKKSIVFFVLFLLIMSSSCLADSLNYSSKSSEDVSAAGNTAGHFIIKDIRQEPSPTNPGEYLDLYMDIENTGGDIETPVFTLITDYPFTVEQQTPEEYPDISSGEKISIHYKILVDQNAVPGDYEMQFKATVDSTTSYSYYFDVTIDDVTSDFDVALQNVDSHSLSLALSNIGKNTAGSITVSIPEQDYFEALGPASSIVGNLNSGDYTLLDLLVAPKEQNTDVNSLPLYLNVSYTDTEGTRRTSNEEVDIIMNYQTQKGFDDLRNYLLYGDQSSTQTSTNYTWGIILGIIVVLGVGYYINRRRKRKKRQAMEE